MSKHTPGPWEAERSCDMTGAPLRAWWISAKGDIDIAETSGEKWPEEEAANARLIAAAPELYEACKEFVRKCECGEARSHRSYAQMKAALAKAEGVERSVNYDKVCLPQPRTTA